MGSGGGAVAKMYNPAIPDSPLLTGANSHRVKAPTACGCLSLYSMILSIFACLKQVRSIVLSELCF